MNLERFRKYVSEQENGCWHWTGGKTPNGYGKCAWYGRTLGAHTVAFRLYKGRIPEGHIIRHTCNNRICVNPEHVISGTYSDNLEDARIANGRVGVLPKIDRETIFKILKLRSEHVSTSNIAVQVALDVGYITGVISGGVQPGLKKEFEDEFGSLPKFHAGHKLTDNERKEIVRLYREGVMRPTDIAD